jgi:hypothetical protein
MQNEILRSKKKEALINKIFKNYKSSQKFTRDDHTRLKLLTQLTKLEELKDIDKLSDYKEVVINEEKPNFKFLRQDAKCLNNDYIPQTSYGYKNRNKKFSTIFKKNLNLDLFTQNKKKIIKRENYFPIDFEEINELIELKKFENLSSINRYLIKENILINKEDYSNNKNISNNSRAMTSKFRKSSYEKCLTEPNLNYDKGKSKRKSDMGRIIKSAKRDTNFLMNNNKNIVNLKLLSKNIYNRNDTNNNLSNYTTTFKSFSTSQSKKNKKEKAYNKLENKVLNHNSFFITRNDINLNNYIQKSNLTEFKPSNKIMNRIINDGFVIDKYIKSNRLKTTKTQRKKDKEKILLKLDERLKKKNDKKIMESKKKDELTDEEIYCKKLSLVPDFAKQFFRDIYNRILFENRVLNKNEIYNIKSAMEKLFNRKKLMKELKKDTIRRMRISKDNFITEKDDQNIIEEQKKNFDFYGNLDGLEWLITKRNIINYGKNSSN